MQIEQDHVEFLSGVRAGETLGSPIAMLIPNRDWKNWQEIMDAAPRPEDSDEAGRKRQVTRVRPGHADLTGLLKYDRDDARDILERASARETTARVAAGAICRTLLAQFGVTIGSHLVHLGGIDADAPRSLSVRHQRRRGRVAAAHARQGRRGDDDRPHRRGESPTATRSAEFAKSSSTVFRSDSAAM